MLFRNPRVFAFVLVATGLGLLGWYGEQWYRLPAWSEADIQRSVELNLALDVQRLGPHLKPTGERLEQLRTIIRAEVEADIRQERESLERWMGVGLILAVLGAGQLVLAQAQRRSG